MKNRLILGGCLEVLPTIMPRSVDLVFGSPPYEDARTYGIDFNLKGQEWVDWMVEVYRACLLRSKGLVAFVVQGRTRKFKWSCTPALLIADLHRAGFNVRNPAIFQKFGIPGSGGPDWLRSDYEWIVCVSQPGRLVWSDNTACGHPPKWGPGGEMSHRQSNGTRRNKWGKSQSHLTSKHGARKKDGSREYSGRPGDDEPIRLDSVPPDYVPPVKANPGNVLSIPVGGGIMGNRLCHENEAPFPEKLAEFFIKSFCPPGGTVLDPFLGSGTTAAVAKKNGRHYIGIDVRQSQIELAEKRLGEIA